jgi:hypothetical protein
MRGAGAFPVLHRFRQVSEYLRRGNFQGAQPPGKRGKGGDAGFRPLPHPRPALSGDADVGDGGTPFPCRGRRLGFTHAFVSAVPCHADVAGKAGAFLPPPLCFAMRCHALPCRVEGRVMDELVASCGA